MGVLLAVTACLAGGAMDVLVAKCSDLGQVSASVLCNWSAICGLFIAVIYGLLEEKSYILSPNIVHITWDQWATFIGKILKLERSPKCQSTNTVQISTKD